MNKSRRAVLTLLFLAALGLLGFAGYYLYSHEEAKRQAAGGQQAPTPTTTMGQSGTQPQSPLDTAAGASSESPILGTQWTWHHTEFLDGTKVSPSAGKAFILSFGMDKTLKSTTDCNTLTGKFVVDGEVLSFTPFVATEMACAPGSLEAAYKADLSRTGSFVMEGDELKLILLRDTGTMIFHRRIGAAQ